VLLKSLYANFTLTSLDLCSVGIRQELRKSINKIIIDNQNRKKRKELIQLLLMGQLSPSSSLYTSFFRNDLCEPWLLVEISQYLYPVLSRQERKQYCFI
jgi:hypothetical protein